MEKRKKNWDKLPITSFALERAKSEGTPAVPAIEREWWNNTQNENDAFMFWGGTWKRQGERIGWTWWWWFDEESAEEGDKHPAVEASPEAVERMLAPLANEGRIRLMQAIYNSPKSSGDLTRITGLKGGNLYYHLKELIRADYVCERDGVYDLTGLGAQMLMTVVGIAGRVIPRTTREGQAVTSDYDEKE